MTAPKRVAAAVVVRAGRVLVQTRSAPGRYHGFWEFPGGGLEPGETMAAAARRECLEELGLAVTVHESLHVECWTYPGVSVEIDFLRCTIGASDEPMPLEGQELLWADTATLAALRFLPAGAAVMQRLADWLE